MEKAYDSSDILERVNERYGGFAISELGNGHHADAYQDIAAAFGYTKEELSGIPDGANLGLGCGNPVALAKLKEGEVVIDLGSGGGFDVFVAARKVGKGGKAIGVDMNPHMLKLARRNAKRHELANVDFIDSVITSIPLEAGLANCIISNCVVNLVPHSQKHLVFKEMYRLLKDGGRIAISDLLARKDLPDDIRSNVDAYVGCIAGAAQVDEYTTWLHEAGFDDILLVDTKHDSNLYKDEEKSNKASQNCAKGCCSTSTTSRDLSSTVSVSLPDYDLNDWIGSFQIYALKN